MERKRIIELDYIRGIAIFMVVMGHVLNFSLDIPSSTLQSLIGICEMPFFFVVSGFLSYRFIEAPKLKTEAVRFFKRSMVLLIPLVVWSFILNVVDGNIRCSMSIFYGGGYWFFLALWWCDLIFAFTSFLSEHKRFGWVNDAILYALIYAFIVVLRMKNITLGGYLPIQNIQYYFPFFTLGIFMRKYPKLQNIVLNKYSYAAGALVLLAGWNLCYLQSYVIMLFAALGAIAVVWKVCREIDHNNPFARILALVGKNTLPIYAMHYLFIAALPVMVRNWVNVPMGFIFQLIVTFIYASAVILICLVVDRMISHNPFTRMFFFGETKKREW